jgi:hypothetical protein
VLVGSRLAEEQRLFEEAEGHYRKALEIYVEFNDRHSRRMFQ